MEPGRMGGGVDLLEFSDADLGIDLRRRELGMAEHLLDEPDICPTLQHERGHGVTEQMAGTTLPDFGGVDVFAHHLGQPAGAERVAQVREEQRAVVGLDGQLGPGLDDVAVDPRQRPPFLHHLHGRQARTRGRFLPLFRTHRRPQTHFQNQLHQPS